MTFGQLKSSYFEECDGVHNSKLWIVEIWRLDNWKARTLRNECDGVHNSKLWIVEIWRLDNWKAHTLRNEECDGVHNSKLWIVEIWRLDNWKARTLRNAMVYITLIVDCWDMTFGQLKSSYFEECDGVHNSKFWIVEIWRLDNWKAHTLRNAMVYITLNFGLLRYDVWTIEKLVLWGMWWCT